MRKETKKIATAFLRELINRIKQINMPDAIGCAVIFGAVCFVLLL